MTLHGVFFDRKWLNLQKLGGEFAKFSATRPVRSIVLYIFWWVAIGRFTGHKSSPGSKTDTPTLKVKMIFWILWPLK